MWGSQPFQSYLTGKELMWVKGLKRGSMPQSQRIKIGNSKRGKKNPINSIKRKGKPPWNKGRRIQRNLKICSVCSKEFWVVPSRNRVNCCSKVCGHIITGKKHRMGIYKNCLNCDKKIYVPKHYLDRKKYCSAKCRVNHLKTERKEELREKLSKSHIGQIAWNKDKIFPKYSGANHPNWNGGSSFEPYGTEFNKQIKNKTRKKYRYRCRLCELKENGKNHITHHIDYDKRNNNENNLILLCNSCHSKTNFNREKWTSRLVSQI